MSADPLATRVTRQLGIDMSGEQQDASPEDAKQRKRERSMTTLPQQCKRPAPSSQGAVLAHHLQNDGVGRVDRHIHAGVGQVDFEGLGFGAGERVHDACPKGFPPPASGV